MIEINGVKKRNLQEQVLKNKEDIEDLKAGRTNPSFSDITGQPSDNAPLRDALNDKVDKVTGKGLSTNDFTNVDKSKLDGIDMSSKQDTLTAAQLDAVNSGMTAADVTAIGALIAQMLTKSPILDAGANITLTPQASGHIEISATGGSGGGSWGSITGTLSNQTDLWNELNSKLGINALTPYRTAANQDAIDVDLRNLITSETTRATGVEGNLQTAINNCLTAAKLVEGQSIDITVNPDGTVVIACSIEAMELKGSVQTFADLPTTARNGDTYIVRSNFKVYTYTSSGWVQSGAAFDVTLFYTKVECDEKFALATALAIETGDREVADTSLGQRITNIELGYIKEVSISGNAITFTKQNDATVTYTPDLSAYRTSADQDIIDTDLQNKIDLKQDKLPEYIDGYFLTCKDDGTGLSPAWEYIDLSVYRTSADQDVIDATFVKLTGDQNITGVKKFAEVWAGDTTTNEYGKLFRDCIQHEVGGTAYQYTYPNKNGTFAMTSDVTAILQTLYDGIFPVGFEYTGISCPGVPTGVNATWTLQTELNNRYPMVLSTTTVKTLQIQMLPNISGYFAIAPSTGGNLGDTLPIKKIGGAFYNAGSLGDTAWRLDDINADYTRSGNPQTVGFNARNSNTIYQDGADVKPYTYTIKHWKRTE